MTNGGDESQYKITPRYALPSGKAFTNSSWMQWDSSTDRWATEFCVEGDENICTFTEKQFMSNGYNRNMSISRVSGDLQIHYKHSGGIYNGRCIKSTEPIERPKAF